MNDLFSFLDKGFQVEGNQKYGLFTKREVNMAVKWPSFFSRSFLARCANLSVRSGLLAWAPGRVLFLAI